MSRPVHTLASLGLLVSILSAPAWAAAPEDAWIKPGSAESLLLDIAAAGGRWVVVGARGHVLISDDAENWMQSPAPTRVLLTAVDLDEAGLGFAVGHDATIIRTRDAGTTWERVHHAPEEEAPLLDVVMVDGERVVAVGAYGLYLESNDAGQTWETRTLEPGELDAAEDAADSDELLYDFHLNDLAIADDGRWYIAAEAGTVYRSDDAGETWLLLPSPYEGSFFGVLPMSGEDVLLFGLQGRLFHSDDAGGKWRRIDTGTDATLSHGLRAGDKALIVGYAGTVLSGVDARGYTAGTTLPNRPALTAARVLDNGDLLTVGEGGIRRWPARELADQ